MENRAGVIETGWTWTGGSTSSKDTWSEIWGDGAGAAVKNGAAIVIVVKLLSGLLLFGNLNIIFQFFYKNIFFYILFWKVKKKVGFW